MLNGLPDFPQFKPLEIEDQACLEQFIRQHPPASDFNFVSMLAFDTQNRFQLANLHDNLIVKFHNYVTATGQPFYSFLGNQQVIATITRLLEHACAEGLPPMLKLVPEANLATVFEEARQMFTIMADADNFDYIIPISHLYGAETGRNGKKKRALIRRFIQNYPQHVVLPLDLCQSAVQTQIHRLCAQWSATRVPTESLDIELMALERVMRFAARLNLSALGVYLHDDLIGFTINEVIHDGYYMSHFGKTDLTYDGLAVYVEASMARMMAKYGCTWCNYEQDGGSAGLRRYKRSWHPTGYLKKYRISPK